jgi:hypothetical protein
MGRVWKRGLPGAAFTDLKPVGGTVLVHSRALRDTP